jgi:hypothetical protein
MLDIGRLLLGKPVFRRQRHPAGCIVHREMNTMFLNCENTCES